MPNTEKTDTSKTDAIKKMRAEGATAGAIARKLKLPLEDVYCLIWGKDYREKLVSFSSGKPLTRNVQQKPTVEAFVKWLETKALPNLKQLTEWPMGVTKYTYFRSEAVWITRVLATIEEPSALANEHRNGDPKAIFIFAKTNRKALFAKWVQRQLVEWRLTNTKQSKEHFDRFMRAYWSQQGKRTISTMIKIIADDQAIYRDSITWAGKSMVNGLVKRHTVSRDRVKDVLKHYRAAYRWWQKSPDAHLWLTTTSLAQ